MHRNTKRLTTALLAAVLCAVLVVPQAAAEPWTYEVDDVMAGYGMEFYPDVGFENPRKNVSAPTQSGGSGTDTAGSADTYSGDTTKAVVSASTAAEHGVIAYSVADEGVSTYSGAGQAVAADVSTAGVRHEASTYSAGGFHVYTESTVADNVYKDTDYTVTIPAEVEVDTATNKGELTIKGELKNCCNLEVTITPQNDPFTMKINGMLTRAGKLQNEGGTEKLTYGISEDKLVFWKNTVNTETTTDTYTVDIWVTDTATVSGTYTDHLTFAMSPKEYTNTNSTLTFNTNAAEGEVVTISTTSKFVTQGEKYGVLPTPKRDGYAFAGWYTAKSGGTLVTEETLAQATSATVYAHWTGNTLTILYHNDGADYIQWDSDPKDNKPDRRVPNATYTYDNGKLTGIKNEDVTLQEVETYGAKFTNSVNGLFNVSRWKKEGYGIQNGTGTDGTTHGGLWKIGKDGARTCGDGDISGWTVEACAEALGVLDDLKQGDVTVDLYPTWVKTGKAATESDAELDDPIVLLPSLDETSPIIVDVPTVDTAADEPASDPDSTSPADAAPDAPAADTPVDVPETTSDELMIWDAADFRLPQEEWDDWT